MNGFGWDDFIRVVTVVLCGMSTFYASKKLSLKDPNEHPSTKWLYVIVIVFSMTLFEGAIEQIALNVGFGPRILLAAILPVFFVYAVKRNKPD